MPISKRYSFPNDVYYNSNMEMVFVEKNSDHFPIIESQFKLDGESDSEILSNIVKNHLASNGYYPDADRLQHGIGLKDIVDIHQDMIITLLDLLESD